MIMDTWTSLDSDSAWFLSVIKSWKLHLIVLCPWDYATSGIFLFIHTVQLFLLSNHQIYFLQPQNAIIGRNQAYITVLPMSNSTIVQYVVVRGDLLKEMGWPVGALIAQACHAVTATTHLFYEDEYTQQYLKDLDNMHKIVLEAPSEESLLTLRNKLLEANIKHKLWIEQPENIPTCLVAKPYPKQEVQNLFKKIKLFKQ